MKLKPSLFVIIPTYKRLDDLQRCAWSLFTAQVNSSFDVSICIFNNDPSVSILAKDLIGQVDFCDRIHVVNRPQNIGPRKNFNLSLIECHQSYNADLYVYVSDDDYVLPGFFEAIYEKSVNERDAIINSCVVINESNLSSEGYALRSHTYRCVPTRPYSDQKLQFIIDSRLMSGTVYRNDVVERFCKYFFESPINQEFVFSLWYPMAFIASFSTDPAFIAAPTFVHAQGNKTFWGNYDAFAEFFVGRLHMFSEMLRIQNISKSQHDKLIADFVAHQQSFKRIVRVMFDTCQPISLRLNLFCRLLKVLLFYRTSYMISAFGKRLPYVAQFTLRI